MVDPAEHQKFAGHARHKANHDDYTDEPRVAFIARWFQAGGS